MARRNFARPHRLHALNELNVTPLLDLCFCLLIIFMIATPVIEQSTRINLPETAKTPGSGTDKSRQKPVIISFTAAGAYMIGGTPATMEEIRAKFKELGQLDKDAQPVVRIRGDRLAPYECYAQLQAAMVAEGLTKVSPDSLPK